MCIFQNKENHCFMSQLVEECYFDKIEVFYLIVGHTHNILDQWFSVLSKAIRAAEFIGSVLALHALYKIAHDDEDKDKRPTDCFQLRTYRDYRKYYDPVRNEDIHNYSLPHRTKFEIDKMFGVSYYQYMFQSPKHGATHLEKWQPVRPLVRTNTMNQRGNILLQPFATVSGEVAVLEELGVNCTDDVPSAINRDSSAGKLVRAASVLPLLRRLEKEAIGETSERMLQEADTGLSTDTIKLTPAILKQIDAEMIKSNSSSEGNIVWLKRSKCSDPHWLEKPPDVLPNPRLWREIIQQPVDEAPASSNSNSSANTKGMYTSSIINEARKRLLAFTRGASDMAATAMEVLAMVKKPGGIPVITDENDIAKATRQFRQRCLTQKEVEFYESIKSVKLITSNAERRALNEEQKPWRLLNLPEISAETRARMLATQQQRAQQLADTEKNIKEILARRGEGEYDPDQQVVSFEGFVPTQTKDLDKMTKDELVTLAKGNIKNIRALKKADLLKQLKEFMEKNPGKILLGTEAILREQDDGAVETTIDMLVEEQEIVAEESPMRVIDEEHSHVDMDSGDAHSNGAISCSIIECVDANSEDLVWCSTCELWFCKDLHGPHKSHSAQTIFKEGRIPKKPVDEDPDMVAIQTLSTIGKKRRSDDDMRSTEQVANDNTGKAIMEIETLEPPMTNRDLERIGIAVRKLRDILSKASKNQKEQLHSALNFSSYDILFLTMIAKEFDIDISSATNKSRVSRIQVLEYLISMLT